MRNIVVVGGGMAGVTATLYAKSHYPDDNVVLIRSDKIGILGAGEGTTKEWTRVLSDLNIPYLSKDFLTQTQATLKYGIMFEGWNSRDYYNGFNAGFLQVERFNRHSLPAYMKQLIDNDFIGFLHYNSKLLKDDDKTAFHLSEYLVHKNYKIGTKSLTNDSFSDDYIEFGLHFDVRSKVKYLENIARERGVDIIDGVYVDCEQNEQGDITTIHYTAGGSLIKQQSDFVFDCTGFARLIMNKKYNQTWTSCKNELPVDQAITYKLPHDVDDLGITKIAPGTVARARNHGWEFIIPVWSEKRCGYLYDSDSCNAQQAVDEIERYYGEKIEIVNQFDFQGGFFDKAWQNNCMAVGLSYGFLEPLEATTHHGVIDALDAVIDRIFDNDERFITVWNSKNYTDWCNTRDWLQFHYMCERSRSDTVFWNKFNEDNVVLSDVAKYVLNKHGGKWKSTTGVTLPADHHMIIRSTVISVLHSNGLITTPARFHYTDAQKQWMLNYYTSTKRSYHMELDSYVDHYSYLKNKHEN